MYQGHKRCRVASDGEYPSIRVAKLVFRRDLGYGAQVKFWFLWRRAGGVIGLCLLLGLSAVGAPSKLVRLRNQTIPPKFAKSLEAGKDLAPGFAVSGLFLVQFTGPLTATARSQLTASGVDLVHYVPEDTFLARFHGVRLDY